MPKKLFSEFDFDSIQFSYSLKKQDSKPEKKESSLSEQVELAEKYCMIDEFKKANEICASVLEKDPFFIPAYACLVRVESQNYTVYTGENLDKHLRFLKRLDKEKEYWNELDSFLKKREEFLNPKPVKQTKEEVVVSTIRK